MALLTQVLTIWQEHLTGGLLWLLMACLILASCALKLATVQQNFNTLCLWVQPVLLFIISP